MDGFSSFFFCQSFISATSLFFFLFSAFISIFLLRTLSFLGKISQNARISIFRYFCIEIYWKIWDLYTCWVSSILLPLCIQVLRQSKSLIFTITAIVSGSYNVQWLTKVFEYLQKFFTNMSNVCWTKHFEISLAWDGTQ